MLDAQKHDGCDALEPIVLGLLLLFLLASKAAPAVETEAAAIEAEHREAVGWQLEGRYALAGRGASFL